MNDDIDFEGLEEDVFSEDDFTFKLGLMLKAITDMYYFGATSSEWVETIENADVLVSEFHMRYEDEINKFTEEFYDV